MEMITSYTFEHSSPSFNRSYQLINKSPYDYSTVNGVDKLIGGPVLTTWPKPHYLKQLHHFEAQNGGSLVRNTAFDWTGDGQNSDLIDVIGSGSVTFSATGTMTSGRSISYVALLTASSLSQLMFT
ncbi:hypothetical protein HK101_005822 [Irineochytrium annulatum]|nr:hypothetical protein HK101_005822 [Irineochytrium annulatum]